MDDTSQTNDGAGADAPAETKVSRGLIADYAAFKSRVSAEVRRLAGLRKSWATEESTELFLFLFDEYVAQLPEVRDGDVVGVVTPDAGDLKEIIGRYVNMNAVSNRLADAKPPLIERKEKTGRKVGTDLI